MTSERHEWPRPFGALAGRLPSIEIEDIKAARREALGAETLALQQVAERLGVSRRHVIRLDEMADELSRSLDALGAPLE